MNTKLSPRLLVLANYQRMATVLIFKNFLMNFLVNNNNNKHEE